MNDTITTLEYSHEGNKRRIRIVPDLDPLNPRADGENFGHLCLKHRRYSLPFEGEPESRNPLTTIILPVWGYDHGGLSMRAGERVWPFDDPWDSGLLGIIWAPKGKDGLSDEEIIEILKFEVETYNAYSNGAVYGFIIEELATFTNSTFGDRDEWVTLDSCYGYYSIEEALDAAKSQANIPQGGSL